MPYLLVLIYGFALGLTGHAPDSPQYWILLSVFISFGISCGLWKRA